MMAHFSIPYLLPSSSTIFGMRGSVFGGAAAVWKKLPSFSSFSLLSGGYHEMSAGLPSKKSGMKTWYFWSSVYARMSAPCSVWLKNPKMS
jgi:hypothetical protein